MSLNLITKEGFKKLQVELETLKSVERPKVIEDIAEARSHGDLRENSEYAAAKEKQVFIENRIAELESLTSELVIFEPETVANKKEIRFGAICTIEDSSKEKKKIQIVSPHEADFSNGLVAIDAPFAKALLGKEEGETFEAMTKGKKQIMKIIKVQY